ncbi:MAG: hypothetical protein Fur005_04090 [Roseiflexaceae bacterium]
MASRRKSEPLSRRAFLKQVAVAGTLTTSALLGAAILPSTQAAVVPHSLGESRLQIGVVVPQGSDAISADLLAGMRLGLQQHSAVVVDLVVQQYHSVSDLHRTLPQLLAEPQIVAVVGMLGRNTADTFGTLLGERRVPLVVADVGANIIKQAEQHPWIARSSLHHWQSALALGDWAARTHGPRALLLSSFYESGFDTLTVFRQGFEHAGGAVIDTIVVDSPMAPRSTQDLIREINRLQPDLIYASASGDVARQILDAVQQAMLPATGQLLGTPSFVQAILKQQPEALPGTLTTATNWPSDLAIPQNQQFQHAFVQSFNRKTTMYGVLGYDTANLLTQSIDLTRPQQGVSPEYLRAATTDGPRGNIAIAAETLDTTGMIYLHQTRTTAAATHTQIQPLGRISSGDSRIEPLRHGLRSGWTSAYLVG